MLIAELSDLSVETPPTTPPDGSSAASSFSVEGRYSGTQQGPRALAVSGGSSWTCDLLKLPGETVQMSASVSFSTPDTNGNGKWSASFSSVPPGDYNVSVYLNAPPSPSRVNPDEYRFTVVGDEAVELGIDWLAAGLPGTGTDTPAVDVTVHYAKDGVQEVSCFVTQAGVVLTQASYKPEPGDQGQHTFPLEFDTTIGPYVIRVQTTSSDGKIRVAGMAYSEAITSPKS